MYKYKPVKWAEPRTKGGLTIVYAWTMFGALQLLCSGGNWWSVAGLNCNRSWRGLDAAKAGVDTFIESELVKQGVLEPVTQ